MNRRYSGFVSVLLLSIGCSAHQGKVASDASPDGPVADAPDTLGMDAAPLGAWGPATAIAGASTAKDEDDVTLSSAATELIFAVAISATDKDLYVMRRATTNDPFGAPTALASMIINTTANEETPRLSLDDLTLYFGRGGTTYKSTRTSTTSAWSMPTVVAGGASPERWYGVCGTDHFTVVRGAVDLDLYEGTIGGTAVNISELNTNKIETSPYLTPDCLTIYFASDRSGTSKIYTSTRSSITSPWSTPELAQAPVNGGADQDPWISADQRLFVWASIRGGSNDKDLYMSTR